MADFKQLDVYRISLQFLHIATTAVSRLPSGHGELATQLRRAALSIPLNIAEGSGRREGPDRHRFRAIARGSAMESAAIWDVLGVMELIESEIYREGEELIDRVISMLTKMMGRVG